LDYGLAYRYKPSGTHIPYKEDPKRRHDGTIEYTSRDAHKGCGKSGLCFIHNLCAIPMTLSFEFETNQFCHPTLTCKGLI